MRPNHGIMGLPGYQKGALIRRLARYVAERAASARRLPMDEASVLSRIERQGYSQWLHGTAHPMGSKGFLSANQPLLGTRPFYQVRNPNVAATYTRFGDEPLKIYSRAPNQLVFDAGGAPYSRIPIERVRAGVHPSRLEEFDRIVTKLTGASVIKGGGPPSFRTELWLANKSYEPTLSSRRLYEIAKEMKYGGVDMDNIRDALVSMPQRTSELWDVPSLVRMTIDPGLIRYPDAVFDPLWRGVNSPRAGITGLIGAETVSNALRDDQRKWHPPMRLP